VIELSLIRHGETEFNAIMKIQGSLDSALTEQGKEQCRKLGRHLARKPNYAHIDEWICSPQGRAVQSSTLIRESLPSLPEVILDDRIREIHCGELEGRLIQEVDPDILRSLRNNPAFPYPGGESIDDVVTRAKDFWSDLSQRLAFRAASQQDYRVVIVSHGNFLRCLASVILELPSEYAVRVVLENTGMCYFRSLHDGARLKMLRWNDRSHLD
jgi:broad specificity phosphatase PhoE